MGLARYVARYLPGLLPRYLPGGGGAWTPALWFLANEQGVWYDPSDFTRYMGELGPELVTDSGFNSPGSWTCEAPWAVASGVATYTDDGAGVKYIQSSTLPTALVAGKTYEVLIDFVAINGAQDAIFAIFNVAANENFLGSYAQVTSIGVKRYVIKPVAGTTAIRIYGNSAGTSTSWSLGSISVRELTAINTATMFQDSAGTTPVTAVEQPVGLALDKRKQQAPTQVTGLTWAKTQGDGVVTVSPDGRTITITGATTTTYVTRTGGNIPFAVGRAWMRVKATHTGATGTAFWLRGGPIGGLASGVSTLLTGNLNNSTLERFDCATGTVTYQIEDFYFYEGNHASQPTTAQKPVLSARKNLALSTNALHTYTTLLSPIVTANAALAPDGTMTATQVEVGAGQTAFSLRNVGPSTLVGNNSNSIYFKLVGGTTGELAVMRSDRATSYCGVNVATRAPLVVNGAGITNSAVTIDALPDGWYRYNGAYTSDTATENRILLQNSVAGAKILLWGVQVEQGNLSTSSTYQRVNTNTDYDTVGFPHYLKFDGVDDNLVTGNIDFTATDKMTLMATVSHQVNAGTVVRNGVAGTNTGMFDMGAYSGGGASVLCYVTGSGSFGARTYPLVIGKTFVEAVSLDLAGTTHSTETLAHRLDGVQPASIGDYGAADTGGGNFRNAALAIGVAMRGNIYQLAVRGAATPDLTTGEAFFATKK